MSRTLLALRDAGRRDLLGLLGTHRLTLAEVHDAYTRDPASLEHLRAKADSPQLGVLVDEWLAWIKSPGGLSPRTRRRYSEKTVRQYQGSWNGFFSVLARGRDAALSDVTQGFVFSYRSARERAVGGRKRKIVSGRPVSPSTLNRDFAALGAFLTWLCDVRSMPVERPRVPHEHEPRGRERWLSADELAAFEACCPPEWWSLFAALFYTGARLGEILGLRGADVLLSAGRLCIHEGDRRVKTRQAVRDLPIPRPLEEALGSHFTRLAAGPDTLVFPGAFQHYSAVRRIWDATCEAAGIQGATPHDARHTFAVHAAQAGVPIVRLQKLLGHATATMTMRYMQHAPEAYLQQDAAAIAAHLAGANDPEIAKRAIAVRLTAKVPASLLAAKRDLSGTASRGLRKSLGPMMFPALAPIAQLVEQLTLNQ